MQRYQVSTPAYVRILFGTSSGVYPYATRSYPSAFENNVWAIVPVTGLQPSTTYYFRMTARPDLTDDTDICKVEYFDRAKPALMASVRQRTRAVHEMPIPT